MKSISETVTVIKVKDDEGNEVYEVSVGGKFYGRYNTLKEFYDLFITPAFQEEIRLKDN